MHHNIQYNENWLLIFDKEKTIIQQTNESNRNNGDQGKDEGKVVIRNAIIKADNSIFPEAVLLYRSIFSGSDFLVKTGQHKGRKNILGNIMHMEKMVFQIKKKIWST